MNRRTFLRSLLSTSALIAGGLSLTHVVPAETWNVDGAVAVSPDHWRVYRAQLEDWGSTVYAQQLLNERNFPSPFRHAPAA